jgi:hypothetical protein
MSTSEKILILPCSTPDFEANIWSAVIDKERDWTDTEKEYLRRNQGLRESIIQWYSFMNGSDWTQANLEFLRPYCKASADRLDSSSTDSSQTTENQS